jgi:hypothetical protein
LQPYGSQVRRRGCRCLGEPVEFRVGVILFVRNQSWTRLWVRKWP